MCGKFTQLIAWAEGLDLSQPPGPMAAGAELRFATPMRMAGVIRTGEDGKREQVPMRWGFGDGRGGSAPKHMHARAETVDSKPRFCDAFAERRGVLLVESFNEGEELANGKTKQWVFSPKDRKPIPIAVIWEEAEDGVATFIQVTVPANVLVSGITDRMPAIVPFADWPVWLGEEDAKLADIKALLRTHDDEGDWEMVEQDVLRPKAGKPAKPEKPAPPKKEQMDLF
jgi:putative SOS response-associated peptidase YedK